MWYPHLLPLSFVPHQLTPLTSSPKLPQTLALASSTPQLHKQLQQHLTVAKPLPKDTEGDGPTLNSLIAQAPLALVRQKRCPCMKLVDTKNRQNDTHNATRDCQKQQDDDVGCWKVTFSFKNAGTPPLTSHLRLSHQPTHHLQRPRSI